MVNTTMHDEASSSNTTGHLTHLLGQVEQNTKVFIEYLSSKNLPEPTFEFGDGLNPAEALPDHISHARECAIEAAEELFHLLLGPFGIILEAPGDQYLLLALQYIYKHQIAPHVPIEGETTFSAIADACGLGVTDVSRFLRCAIARHVLHEPRKGVVVHTASSRMLLNNSLLRSWIMNVAQEFWPSLTKMVEAGEKWPSSEEPNETGYSLSHSTLENPFDVIKKDPRRQQQFIDAMSFSHSHPSFHMKHLVENFDFASLGRATIVDVGGSHGQVSIAIARKFREITCIVQDLPDTIMGLRGYIPEELKDRILGMEHDFLTPQPVRCADLYLLRWILHDWSDKYCIQILQALVPGLKKGSKILVNDVCIPEPGQLGPRANRSLRLMDISMKAFNNARERDAETWAWLFAMADKRFDFIGITMVPESRMAIIEAIWAGE